MSQIRKKIRLVPLIGYKKTMYCCKEKKMKILMMAHEFYEEFLFLRLYLVEKYLFLLLFLIL